MTRILVASLLLALSLQAQSNNQEPNNARSAPPLVVPIVTGGVADLSQLRGRVVLVNYWASWCPPCLMEMPSMDRLTRIMGRSPFVLLAVNTDQSQDWLQNFIQKTHLSFPIGMDNGGQNLHAWGGAMVPASFVVDKLGRIRYSRVGSTDWDSPAMITLINNLMAEQMPAERAPAWRWYMKR